MSIYVILSKQNRTADRRSWDPVRLFVSFALLVAFLCPLLLAVCVPCVVRAEKTWDDSLNLNCAEALLMDADTGAVLYEKNGYDVQYPASITKMMTAILVVENCDMDEEVTFSSSAVQLERGASNIGITAGEVLTVEECLYALLLASANECANALAEHVSGSVEAFAKLMTERAAELGALNTNFTNPHGLHDDNHYTTAYDMALIAREFLNHEELLQIEKALSYTIPGTNLVSESRTFQQKHNMAYPANQYYYTGASFLAGKTGYTDDAATTLVTCIEKDGIRLIAVILRGSGKNVYLDTAAMFDRAFETLSVVTVGEIADYVLDKEEIIEALQVQMNLEVSEVSCDSALTLLLPVNYDPSLLSSSLSLSGSLEESGYVGDVVVSYDEAYAIAIPVYVDPETVNLKSSSEVRLQAVSEEKDPQNSGSSWVATLGIAVLFLGILCLVVITFLVLWLRVTRKRKEKLMRRKSRREHLRQNSYQRS